MHCGCKTTFAGAIEANSKALALGEALLADDPLNADYRRCLVLNYQHGGDFRRESDKRGALEYFRRQRHSMKSCSWRIRATR